MFSCCKVDTVSTDTPSDMCPLHPSFPIQKVCIQNRCLQPLCRVCEAQHLKIHEMLTTQPKLMNSQIVKHYALEECQREIRFLEKVPNVTISNLSAKEQIFKMIDEFFLGTTVNRLAILRQRERVLLTHPHIATHESVKVKRQLSPSNYPSNFHTKTTVKKRDIKQQNIFFSVQIGEDKGKSSGKREEGSLERVRGLETENRVLTDGIEELRKENMELMDNNGILKNQIFQREGDKIAVKKLEQEIFRLQRQMQSFQTLVKQKTNFINIQMAAKQYNAKLLDDKDFQLRQMYHIVDQQRQKVNIMNIKVKKLQEESLKLKKRIRQLQSITQQKQNKQLNQSIRDNQNLKQKIRVLQGINDRQKQQIQDLLSAMGQGHREMMHSTTSSDFKLQINNQPFDNQYSEILHRCVTENDSDELRSKIVELQNIIKELKSENNQLKQKIGLPKPIASSKLSLTQLTTQINDLLSQKQQYQHQLQSQHSKLVDMNEQIFQMNHQNYLLRDEKQHYYDMLKQMEQTNSKLTDKLSVLYEDKLSIVECLRRLEEEVKGYEELKEKYQILEEECQCLRENNQQGELIIQQLTRKKKQLLIYVQQLRISQQKLNDQLIEKQHQLQQLLSSHSSPISKFNPSVSKDQSKIQKLLRQRNIKIMNNMNKFKESVISEIRIMEVQLLVAQSTCKVSEGREVIVKLKRRVKGILENN